VAGDIQIAGLVYDYRGVGVIAIPETEHASVLSPALQDVRDVPSLNQSATVGEVDHALVESHGVLDRDVLIVDLRKQLMVPARNLHDDFRADGHKSICVVVTVEADHVEP